jgi:hypothetical protein
VYVPDWAEPSTVPDQLPDSEAAGLAAAHKAHVAGLAADVGEENMLPENEPSPEGRFSENAPGNRILGIGSPNPPVVAHVEPAWRRCRDNGRWRRADLRRHRIVTSTTATPAGQGRDRTSMPF